MNYRWGGNNSTLSRPIQVSAPRYHPISIGDVLVDRYTVVHKLGYGGWSTIWLARDAALGRYVAIKIALADAGSREIEMLRELASHPAAWTTHRICQSAVPEVIDNFTIHGPNGTHSAIVTCPAMVSVAKAKEGSDLGVFQLPVARAIAAQLALAVAYVHSRGIVHGGE
ncbi:kinase-like protein [Canariomyces notabilis]|uniref:non-specific serine/threonine protein kinase n=1 Tax=Canariomyces notabilis TaxID=2074819 RepID=A0AAN6YS64_9PEZI|nr:kinase-like protein [Canariomyces arenarius]